MPLPFWELYSVMLVTLNSIPDERRPNLNSSQKQTWCISSLAWLLKFPLSFCLTPRSLSFPQQHTSVPTLWQSIAILYGVFLVLQAIAWTDIPLSNKPRPSWPPSQDSSLSIGTSLRPGRFGIRFLARPWDFFFFKVTRPAVGPSQSRAQPLLRAKRPELQTNHSLLPKPNFSFYFFSFSHFARHSTTFIVELTTSNKPWWKEPQLCVYRRVRYLYYFAIHSFKCHLLL